MDDNDKKTVYSYHTFLLPFRWEDLNMDKFVKKLNISDNGWSEILWNKEKNFFDADCDRRIEYNEYQYFHENVRNAIYGNENNDIVRNFAFRYKYFTDNGVPISFVIKKEKEWTLKVNAIRLKLYNTGVGILIYELENYNYKDIEDVLKINEYGRRIAIPYVSVFNNSCSLIADVIEITGIAKCEFSNEIAKFTDKNVNYNFISPIITEILGKNFTFKDENNKIKCHVIGDDRMFVCCLFDNDSFCQDLTIWDSTNKKYAWEMDCIEKTHWNQSKLYEFVFIDGDGISCIDRNMRLELLKKALYTRFSEYNPETPKDRTNYGTITAVTHHSFVCVPTYSGEIATFLTMRIQMAIIVLTQRASIISLAHRASKLSQKFQNNEKILDKQIPKIQKLQEEYVAFQNQLLFFEITAQEQGVELYKLFQESLYVPNEEDKLKQQLSNLHEIANLYGERKSNTMMSRLAIIGGVLALLQVLVPFFRS
ncbi:MAG: hypothetical protein LBT51_08960 [Fusobacteriaceae bacterium]|jgi:hypothetical protein|nr:hypothetical protein [Fusobacteriaceae bacterium]